jgi:hypothetical protein
VCGFLPSLYACMLNDCRISILSLWSNRHRSVGLVWPL